MEEDPVMGHQSHNREADLETSNNNSLLHNNTHCCCFYFPCFGASRRRSSSAWWQIQSDHHRWWAPGVRAVIKIREWSEIVAGPKWKTFIRRFNRNRSGCGGGGGGGSGNNRHGKFQYDPLSYSLNFDEGPGQIGNSDDVVDDFGGVRDFSTRYASVSASGKAMAAGNDVAVFG